MNHSNIATSAEILIARNASKSGIIFGAILSVIGIFAVLAPLFAGIAVTVLVGLLLLGAGVFEVLFALKAGSFGKGALRFLFGGLGILAGVVVLATPGRSLGVLTIVLAIFFMTGGIFDLVLAMRIRPEEGWEWFLFSGIVSIFLVALTVAQWPVSGVWAVGLFVGIRMMLHGWLLMALGRAGQVILTHLQDTRIEMLEGHVRECARALQETRASLAEHTGMLLALDNELRKKVSSSEIDPAIQELNRRLSEAREQMQAAASATRDSWSTAQHEANAAFEALQNSAAEIAHRLKKELGLEGQNRSSKGEST
jgi:uncharacterized membrane protein HdeD (DUF308 family)